MQQLDLTPRSSTNSSQQAEVTFTRAGELKISGNQSTIQELLENTDLLTSSDHRASQERKLEETKRLSEEAIARQSNLTILAIHFFLLLTGIIGLTIYLRASQTSHEQHNTEFAGRTCTQQQIIGTGNRGRSSRGKHHQQRSHKRLLRTP